MRFLADMGVSMKTVSWLRSLGHDAVHLRDQGLQRLPDARILDKAFDEDRVILTMDLDFGQLLALSSAAWPSVIIFRLDDQDFTVVNTRLEEVMAYYPRELSAGSILSVDEYTVRVRRLPVQRY